MSLQKYSVPLFNAPVPLVVVPSSQDANAQYLTSAVYQNIDKNDINRIIMVFQSEHTFFHGVALPSSFLIQKMFSHFLIDNIFIESLSHQSLFHYYDAAYACVSGCDNQLEYLQHYVHHGVTIVPLIVGHITHQNADEIASEIASSLDDHTLIIFVLNLSSDQDCTNKAFYTQQSGLAMYDRDSFLIQAIQGIPAGSQAFDWYTLHEKNGHVLLLKMLEQPQFKNITSHFIGYDISIGMYGMESYVAFMYEKNQKYGYKNCIGAYEEQQLIHLAHASLSSLFEPIVFKNRYIISYEMTQPHRAFVSLHAMTDHGSLLRGCMGLMSIEKPLLDVVSDMTEQAATLDYRFYPLKHQELKSTMISIALISDLERVTHLPTIQQTDGILFEYGDSSAIALTSKDLVDGWKYEDALTDLCFQARVHLSAWSEQKATIYRFNSRAFQ